jgi:hypothetical protein
VSKRRPNLFVVTSIFYGYLLTIPCHSFLCAKERRLGLLELRTEHTGLKSVEAHYRTWVVPIKPKGRVFLKHKNKNIPKVILFSKFTKIDIFCLFNE